MGFLRRSAKPNIPASTFKVLSTAMVLPLFDYCSVAWSECGCTKTDKLVKLYNRLARLILDANPRSHIAELYEALSWLTLPQRWHNHRMCEVYKCIKGLTPKYLSSRFNAPVHKVGTRSLANGSLSISFTPKSNAGKSTFQYLGTLGWNQLTTSQRQAETLSIFKSLLT